MIEYILVLQLRPGIAGYRLEIIFLFRNPNAFLRHKDISLRFQQYCIGMRLAAVCLQLFAVDRYAYERENNIISAGGLIGDVFRSM